VNAELAKSRALCAAGPPRSGDAGAKLAALLRTHILIAAQIVKAAKAGDNRNRKGYTTTEIVSRLKGDWTADIAVYVQGHAHMLMFADMLADGIVKQFPAKFSK
jgi:hypothetical protein